MNDMIDKIYKPANGQPDDWKCGLLVNGDRLEQYLGDSPVLASIQTAGEHLLHARRIIQALEDNKDDEIEDSLADELCEAFSCFARLPTIRFYNALLVMKQVVPKAIAKRAPKKFSELPWTQAQFHALITHCLIIQIMINTKGPSEDLIMEMVRCMDACIKARPDDATIYVLFGNWLMVNGFTQDASEKLEHAVKLDEDTCFGSYYTIANMCQNAVPDFQKVNQSNDIMVQIQAQAFTERCVHNLRRYLDLAPVGHWHVHRACMSLVLLNGTTKARGKESIASIEKRHPGFCAESQALFQRGVEALRMYENCFGKEQSDFHHQYKQASGMIAQMQKDGLLVHDDDEKQQALLKGDHICSFPTCTKAESVGKKNNRLRQCSRCGTPYCSRECQAEHWKVHKKECKKLAAERKERQAANPVKLKRPDVKTPQIGDDKK